MIWTVLTGDIVGSSALRASALDSVLDAIRMAVDDISEWEGLREARSGFARRGGDAWQAAWDAPEPGLRASLYIRACVRRAGKGFETRIAVAVDRGVLPADGDVNRASGPAFIASGRLLDNLPSHSLMSHADGGARAAAVILADHIARGWTEAQARAMAEMLPPGAGPRAEAAARLGISRQAVDQALHAAGYPALDAAIRAWETGSRPDLRERGE